jgi:hypothetical protein
MKLGAASEVTPEQVPSAEEVSKLSDSAKEGFARAFILTDSLTGAREGELLALHSLRHFHASALLLAGIPIAEVSARLGHKNAAITMKVYTHFIRGAESKAAETIAGLIRSAREAPRSQTGLNG